MEEYAIPRVISKISYDCYNSGLMEKYRNREIYGAPLSCGIYMDREFFPDVLYIST